jgi:hypothetical protein
MHQIDHKIATDEELATFCYVRTKFSSVRFNETEEAAGEARKLKRSLVKRGASFLV